MKAFKSFMFFLVLTMSIAIVGVGTACAYDIYGACSISKASIAKSATANDLNATSPDAVTLRSDPYWAASNGWTTATEDLDFVYVSLDTYRDGVRQNFDSNSDNNTDYVEMDDVNGPAYSSYYWEVYSCHSGHNDGGQFIDKYHWNSATLNP